MAQRPQGTIGGRCEGGKMGVGDEECKKGGRSETGDAAPMDQGIGA
mgnify:CR=1 FL=1